MQVVRGPNQWEVVWCQVRNLTLAGCLALAMCALYICLRAPLIANRIEATPLWIGVAYVFAVIATATWAWNAVFGFLGEIKRCPSHRMAEFWTSNLLRWRWLRVVHCALLVALVVTIVVWAEHLFALGPLWEAGLCLLVGVASAFFVVSLCELHPYLFPPQSKSIQRKPVRRVDPATSIKAALVPLRIGDIIGLAGESRSSTLIQRVTSGPLSHVALYIGNGLFSDAVMPRARLASLPEILGHRRISRVVVLRARPSVIRLCDSPKLQKEFVREALFYHYSLYGLVKAAAFAVGWLRVIAARDALICSEFVCQVYKRVDVQLIADREPGGVSPNDLLHSPALRDVTGKCGTLTQLTRDWTGEMLPRDSRVLGILTSIWNWLAAALYAISPRRRMWQIPSSQWSHFQCAWFALSSVRALVTMRIKYALMRIICSSMDYFPRHAYVEPPPDFASSSAQLDSDETYVGELLELHNEFGLRPGEFPGTWADIIAHTEAARIRTLRQSRRLVSRVRMRMRQLHGLGAFGVSRE